MAEPSQAQVVAALEQVAHPAYGRSLGALGLLHDVALTGDTVTARVVLNAPAESWQRQIREGAEAALAPLGLGKLQIGWDLQVPMRRVAADDPVAAVRNVILVMSGKGGVGKSTTAVNLAMALSRSGSRVGILDADIYGPSIPTMLGVSDNPRSVDGKIAPVTRFGVKLMSIGFMIESSKDAIIWRGPMVQGALNQFLKDVAWGELDYLVLDLPPGTGDVALSIAQRLKTTGAVIVTTPQEIALQDVYKSVSMCKKLNIQVLGVIENMSYFVDPAGIRHELFGAGGGARIAEYAGAPLLSQIPLDPLVRQWGDDGTPLVQAQPEHPVSRAFMALAERLTTDIAVRSFEAAGGDKAPDVKGQRRLKIVR
jgi:ATP-binding protein involved in chromosome partitioning